MLKFIDDLLIKHNQQRKENLKDYMEKIHSETAKIDCENLQEPKISLLGPALEASKYYIDEKVIRDIFAKLIATSFDKSKNDKLHHSYIEIVKQLSPLDANVFKNLKSPFYLITCLTKISNANEDVLQDILVNNEFPEVDQRTGILFNNLKRLGLIHITNNIGRVKIDSNYEPIINCFKQTNYFHEICKRYGEDKIELLSQPCHITELGFCFRDICIN